MSGGSPVDGAPPTPVVIRVYRAAGWSTTLRHNPVDYRHAKPVLRGRLTEIEQVNFGNRLRHGLGDRHKFGYLLPALRRWLASVTQNACGLRWLNLYLFRSADRAFHSGLLAFTRVIIPTRSASQSEAPALAR